MNFRLPRGGLDPKSSSAESGLTVIELIIAASMTIVLTGAAMAMLITALQRQPDLTQRADEVGDARTAVERIVREIRQGVIGSAVVANSATVSELQLETYVDKKCGSTTVSTGTKCRVVYKCEAEACNRTTGTGTTSTDLFVSGVKNVGSIFSAVQGPSACSTTAMEVVNFIEVKLELKSKKGGVTALQDGAALRSCS